MPTPPYVPTAPFTATSNSILSQDVITADTLQVSSSSGNPIGAFPNPNTLAIEALYIDDTGALAHATRSSSGETGWAVTPLNVQAAEAAAGTAYANSSNPSTYGFYHDNTNLYYLTFDGTNWSAQGTSLGPAITNMKITYAADGMLVVYGTSSGTLYAYSANPDGTFTNTEWAVSPAADLHVIAYAADNVPSLQAAWTEGGQMILALGTVGSSTPATPPAPTDGVGVTQVVHGFWNPTKNSASFLFLAGQDLWNYCGSSQQIQTGGPSVATAGGFQRNEDDGSVSMHVYAIDSGNTLWVLHQNPLTPWSQNDLPIFTQFIPLDANVSNVVVDMNPADAPTLFAIDRSSITKRANTLRMHAQDPESGHWWADNMFVNTPSQPFEVTRFRTEITVTDANGFPAPGVPVTLGVASGQSSVTVAIGQTTYGISDSVSANAISDSRGKITMAVMASSSMATPQIVVTGTNINLPVEATLPLHNYLAGNGTLNSTNPGGGLTPFDSAGSTLSGATVGGQSIIKSGTQSGDIATVAGSLQQFGQLALNKAGVSSGGSTPMVARAHMRAQPMAAFSIGSWFDHVAGDVVHAAEQGLLTVTNAVVSAVGDAIQLTVKELDSVVNFAINGLEDIAHAIASAVMYVVDKVEDFINWLKALFNFPAILRTASVFSAALLALPDYLQNTLASQATTVSNWLTSQKQSGALKSAFGSYTTSNTFSASSPQYSSPAAGASPTPVGNSNVAPSDCVNNVHHNFVQDKVTSGASGTNNPYSGSSDPWTNFDTALGASLQEFTAAFNQFASAIEAFFSDADSIGSFSMSTFLGNIATDLIDALIDFAIAAVNALAGITSDVMSALTSMLTTEVPIPFLQTIWTWISGSNNPLRIVDLISLLAALPVTIIYTLATGNEPFPAPSDDAKRARPMDSSDDGGMVVITNPEIAAIIQILSWFPAAISLALGPVPFWPLTLAGAAMAGLVFYFGGGPDMLTKQEWTDIGDIATLGVLVVPAAVFLIKTSEATASEITTTSSDYAKLARTGAGALLLLFAIVRAAKSEVTPTDTAAHVMMSMTPLFAFLQTSYFTGNEGVTAFNALIITVGYIIGGATYLGASS